MNETHRRVLLTMRQPLKTQRTLEALLLHLQMRQSLIAQINANSSIPESTLQRLRIGLGWLSERTPPDIFLKHFLSASLMALEISMTLEMA